jgi:hypothetical protein
MERVYGLQWENGLDNKTRQQLRNAGNTKTNFDLKVSKFFLFSPFNFKVDIKEN